jgi:catechol 2,3-dioxygenase-like lactoylglutathione lyase family enzyme
MRPLPLLRRIDAVTIPVPDLDSGLRSYRDALGHSLAWRADTLGQAGLRLPGNETEIVLSTGMAYAPNWLVAPADEAVEEFAASAGRVVTAPFDIPVGRVAVACDVFDNLLVLVDLSVGRYTTDDTGSVTGVVAT